MKFLIWIGCAFLYGIIDTAFSYAGITLGGLPTVLLAAGALSLGHALCKQYDRKKKEKPSDATPNKYGRVLSGWLLALLPLLFVIPFVFSELTDTTVTIETPPSPHMKYEDVGVPYSPDMKYGDKAYIDVLSFKPKYTTADPYSPASNKQYVVCETTIKRIRYEHILVAMPDLSYLLFSEGNKTAIVDQVHFYSYSAPVQSYPVLFFPEESYRLHCQVSNTEQFGISDKAGDKIVLRVNKISKID